MKRRSKDVFHGSDNPEAGQDGIPAGHGRFSEFTDFFIQLCLNFNAESEPHHDLVYENFQFLQALTVQQRLVEKVKVGGDGVLVIVEHDPVYTTGMRTKVKPLILLPN